MNCPSDDTIALFIQGNLSQDQLDEASRHFLNCSGCLRIVASVKKAGYLKSNLPEETRSKLKQIARPKIVRLVLLPVACCLVGVLAGFLILNSLFSNSENPTIVVKEIVPTGEIAFVSSFSGSDAKPMIGGQPAKLLQAIYPGQVIEGTAKLSFVDGTEVSLNKSTLEVVNSKLWRFRKGELWAKRKSETSIQIETGNGLVNVGATELTLLTDEEKTDVNVLNGHVMIKDDSTEHQVKEGMFAQMKKRLPLFLTKLDNPNRPGWLKKLASVLLNPNERKEFWFRSFENSNEDDWNVVFGGKRAKFSCGKQDESRIQVFGKMPLQIDRTLEIEFRVKWPDMWRPWKGAFIIKNKEVGELRLAFRKRSMHLMSIERGREPIELDKMRMKREEYLVKIRLEKVRISLWIDDKLQYQDSTRLGELDHAFLGFVIAGSRDDVIIEDFKVSHLDE